MAFGFKDLLRDAQKAYLAKLHDDHLSCCFPLPRDKMEVLLCNTAQQFASSNRMKTKSRATDKLISISLTVALMRSNPRSITFAQGTGGLAGRSPSSFESISVS
jgi:hypothetical protein